MLWLFSRVRRYAADTAALMIDRLRRAFTKQAARTLPGVLVTFSLLAALTPREPLHASDGFVPLGRTDAREFSVASSPEQNALTDLASTFAQIAV